MSARQALRMHEAAANDARPMHDLFTAWVQRGNGTAQRIDCHVRSFDEALQGALMSCQHKDTLFLLHTDRISGNKMLHCYVIRQGKRIYRGALEGYVAPLKPDLVFSTPVIDFAPVEPWRWTPGCDVVGADRGFIEGVDQ